MNTLPFSMSQPLGNRYVCYQHKKCIFESKPLALCFQMHCVELMALFFFLASLFYYLMFCLYFLTQLRKSYIVRCVEDIKRSPAVYLPLKQLHYLARSITKGGASYFKTEKVSTMPHYSIPPHTTPYCNDHSRADHTELNSVI